MSTENYSKTTWNAGDVITTHKLNKIEQAITDISEEIIDARTNNKSDKSTLGARIDDMIKVGSSNPRNLSANTEIWINTDSNDFIEVPSAAEVTAQINQSIADSDAATDRKISNVRSDTSENLANAVAQINRRIDDTIVVANTISGINGNTEVWIQKNGEDIVVPSYAEFSNLANQVSNLSGNSSSSLSSLENAVSGLGNRVTTLENNSVTTSTLNTFKTENVDPISTSVGTLTTDVNTLKNTTVPGISSRVSTLEGNSVSTTELASFKTDYVDPLSTELGNARGDYSDLDARLDAIAEDASSASYNIEIVDDLDEMLASVGNDYTFYLYKNADDVYEKYWYIDDGTGNKIWDKWGSGEGGKIVVDDELPVSGRADTDYYIGSTGSYVHYRWIDNAWEAVGGDTSAISGLTTRVGNLETTTSGLSSTVSGLSSTVSTLNGRTSVSDITKGSNPNSFVVSYSDSTSKTVTLDSAEGVTVKTIEQDAEDLSKLTITYTDDSEDTINLPQGGGGSGTGGGTLQFTYINSNNVQLMYGNSHTIQYKIVAKDSDNYFLGNGTATWSVGGVKRATSTAVNAVEGTEINSFDITPYLIVGENKVKVSISVENGDSVLTTVKNWTINVVNFYLDWNYNESTINEGDTLSLQWTPYGADITKTTHIVVDGIEIDTATTTQSGQSSTKTISVASLSHGAHRFELYMTATISGVNERSTSVFHDVIIAKAENNTPIIACSINATTMEQFDTLRIPIVIYTPNQATSNATLAVNGSTITTWTDIDTTIHYWYYTPSSEGTKTLTITSGATTKTITVTVTAININNEEVSGYDFKLKASEFASNNALREWYCDSQHPTTSRITFSNNFDWVNGGLKTEFDENNNAQQYICVKAGTAMTIPYKLFETESAAGRNFKMIFKVVNCSNYDAQILDCMDSDIGIEMFAHSAGLSSSGRTVETHYGEDIYTELEFEIYPRNNSLNEPANNTYMMCWIDGVITSARVYEGTDSFVQQTAQDIVIGSTYCDVYVYLVKVYSTVLSFNEHIANFIADAPNAQEMKKRFNRNDILDSTEEISYEKLVDKNPDCRVWLYEIPYLTNAKDNKVAGCNFQQFWKNGSTAENGLSGIGTMSIQGTSSVNYIRGAANTDINFTSLTDGNGNDLLANATKDSTYGNNWFIEDDQNPGHAKVFIYNGETLGPECVVVERNNGEITKYIKAVGYKINSTSCPITYANTKVNFASCEQVNNMCNVAWYQRFNPYPSLTARDCMEFSMGVQFILDHAQLPDNQHFQVFPNDNKYHMYSIANFGNSKKNVHIFHDLSNENEVCIEVNDNDKDQMRMISSDLTEEDWSGKKFFGMRYPDTKDPSQEVRDAWQRLVSWMALRNPAAATNAALAQSETFTDYTFRGHNREGTQVLKNTTVTQYSGTYTTDSFNYRMAKMLSECEDYLVMDSLVYHYLFLERHTMVDNVSKNNFWSSTDLLHWDLSKAYDMDTSDGNNNQGQLVFDYGNEFNDTINNIPVFNGSDSVWFVFVANLYEACQTMFLNRESAGAWSATAYHNFLLTEQQKVPERCWNQCYWYDYLRTHEDGISDAWITFLDGGQKTHQRQHYEYFEELYDASKYRGAASTSQAVNFRAYTPNEWAGVEPKGEVTVSMYNKMYITVDSGTTLLSPIKAQRATPVVIDFSNQGIIGNTLIRINTASMIQTISGLEQLYSDTYDFSAAVRLRELTIGSLATGYQNAQLSDSLSLANNRMLERLYVQNLPNTNFALNLSGCPSLKYVDARGSGFTGYIFAKGGLLQEAYLEKPNAIEMRDLAYITNANFNIVDISSLISLRLENCPQFDTLTFVRSAPALTTVRLIGLDWTDDSGLNSTTLLNTLLGMRGISDAGITIVKPINNTNRHGGSVLTGEVEIDGSIRSQEIADYNDAWNGLILYYDSNDVIPQYRVSFVNDDANQTELYYEYVDLNGTATDPVLNNYIDTPTKAATEEYTYTFTGWETLNSGEAIGGQIIEPTTYIATYSQEVRTYTVTWYEAAGVPLKQVTNVAYGSYLVYEDQTHDAIPVYSGGTQSGYRLFSGWDKSTGRITGDTNVYAIWERGVTPGTSYFDDPTHTLNDLTPAEIYAYAYQSLGAKNVPIMSYKDVQLGHDFNFTPADGQPYQPGHVRQTVLCQNHVLDGTQSKVLSFENIKPLEENGPFTIMIDYKLAESGYGTILSCFTDANDTQRGFRLTYAPSGSLVQTSVQWETTSQNMGYCNGNNSIVNLFYRNILVLRHEAGSKNLKCYCDSRGDNGVSSMYQTEISTYEFNGLNNQTIDTNLIIGATSSGNRGKGMIYMAKIWYDDLGDDNCKQLAAWPHETIRLEYVGSNLYDNADLNDQNVKMTFNANNLLGQLSYPMYTNVNVDNYVWANSIMKTFCNTRVLKAFPTVWQAMIAKSSIPTRASSDTVYNNNSDYIFIPSAYEVNQELSATLYSERGVISWMNDGGSHLLEDENGNTRMYPAGATSSAAFTRVKFSGLIMKDDAVYLKYYQNPYSLTISGYPQLKTGDIWLKTSSATNTNVNLIFYYISEIDLTTNPLYYNMPIYVGSTGEITFDCIKNGSRDGGWVPALTPWYTRTAMRERNGFYYVNTQGNIENMPASSSAYGIDIMLSL